MSFIFYSCKKDKNSSNSHTIKGSFVNCNNGNSTYNYNNTVIDLFQQSNGSNNNSKVLANTSTDSQGNFTFNYNTSNIRDKLIIRTSTGFGFFKIIEGIPIEDLPNLKIFTGNYGLVVSLNVTKPYTNNDTLVIIKPDSNLLKKYSGPFVSGRIFSCKNVGILGPVYYESNGAILQAGLNNFLDLNKSYVIENSKLCGDTVYVNIDVR